MKSNTSTTIFIAIQLLAAAAFLTFLLWAARAGAAELPPAATYQCENRKVQVSLNAITIDDTKTAAYTDQSPALFERKDGSVYQADAYIYEDRYGMIVGDGAVVFIDALIGESLSCKVQ